MRHDQPQLVILDIDGTLPDTPHLAAWRTATAALLADFGLGSGPPLSEEVYQRRIAGRPRAVGAAAAIAASGVEPNTALVTELTRRKQDLFGSLSGDTRLFDDAMRFLKKAASTRAPVAFCTASRNAGPLLRDWLVALSGVPGSPGG